VEEEVMDTLYSKITGMDHPKKQAYLDTIDMLKRQQVDEQYKAAIEPGLEDRSFMFIPGSLLGRSARLAQGPKTITKDMFEKETQDLLNMMSRRYTKYVDKSLAEQYAIRDLARNYGKYYTVPRQFREGGVAGSLLNDSIYAIQGIYSNPKTVGLLSGGNTAGYSIDQLLGEDR